MKIEIIKAFYPHSFVQVDPLEKGFLISVKKRIQSNMREGIAVGAVALLWTNDIGPCSAEQAYKKWLSKFYEPDFWITIEPMNGNELMKETGLSRDEILKRLR